MANSQEFIDYVKELLAGMPELRSRAMFGGMSIYSGDYMFGIIADDVLYIRVDDESRAAFEAEGCEPLMVTMKGKSQPMSYYNLPESALDAPEDAMHWARLGMDAALRKAAGKRSR